MRVQCLGFFERMRFIVSISSLELICAPDFEFCRSIRFVTGWIRNDIVVESQVSLFPCLYTSTLCLKHFFCHDEYVCNLIYATIFAFNRFDNYIIIISMSSFAWMFFFSRNIIIEFKFEINIIFKHVLFISGGKAFSCDRSWEFYTSIDYLRFIYLFIRF